MLRPEVQCVVPEPLGDRLHDVRFVETLLSLLLRPPRAVSPLFTLGSSDSLSTQRVSFDFLRTCQIKSTESNSVPTSAVLHHHHHHHHYSIVAASSHFVKNVVKSGEKKIIRFILSLGFYFEATVSCGAELCRNETYRLS